MFNWDKEDRDYGLLDRYFIGGGGGYYSEDTDSNLNEDTVINDSDNGSDETTPLYRTSEDQGEES